MKITAKAAFVALGVSAVSLLVTEAAFANSIIVDTQGGRAQYDDGGDRFCVHASDSEGARWIKATVKPLNGVGPTLNLSDNNTTPANHCGSLATAYEDTKYRATITAYWGETGTVTSKTVDFYS
ncbi:hypothetical protein [Amycolatopsis sp. NPDC059657]|uniref:hypothetical protein n=1 Tax=Amycolatopsis sp. NPDC059657 TaxID=3346899 RepID=UPI003672CBAA